MATALAELSSKLSLDPDAQATVTDFLDYTEFFPSDLSRSLTLIGKLDAEYQQDIQNLHELTKTYGILPTLPAAERPQPQDVRKDISMALDHAIRCRQSTFAEATRLHNLAENLYSRLDTIKKKLQSLPKPPSREPTPVPAAHSPTANRSRKADNERAPRIQLYTDEHRHARSHGPNKTSHRSRRVIVPGEVLPPYDPNSPESSVESDSESERLSSPAPAAARLQDKPTVEKVIKIPKATTIKIMKPIPARARAPGVMGTNVHSTVAGISVSNAMAILAPPPPDPIPGSKHAPWLKLTEWELNKLRKRMKKNADWVPSDTMVRRELAENKRGLENYMKAKAEAEATGGELVDEEPEPFVRPVTSRGHAGERPVNAIMDTKAVESLENRGMKLNQAKKLKRHTLLQELAAREQHGPEGSERSTTEGSFDTILVNPEKIIAVEPVPKEKPLEPIEEATLAGNKRKRKLSIDTPIPVIDPALLAVDEQLARPQPKKLKLAPPAQVVNDAGNGGDEVQPVGAQTIHNSEPAMISVAASTPEQQVSAAGAKQYKAPHSPTIAASPTPPETAFLAEVKPIKTNTRSNRASALSTKAQTPAPPDTPSVPEPAAVPSTRPRSRGSAAILSLTFNNKKAASAEPPIRRTSGRRTSNASLPSTQANTPAKAMLPPPMTTRRGKGPAPGVLAFHDNKDGLQVVVGKRKVAPAMRKTKPISLSMGKKYQQRNGGPTPAIAVEKAEGEEDEYDDDQRLYCICQSVSWGNMIACENETCENEWFHFECVGLTEMPGRRTAWYCPDCRKKLGVTQNGEPAGRATAGRK